MESVINFVVELMTTNTVFVPIVLAVISLIVGMKLGKALRSALITSVALIGIWTILDLFMSNITPLATAISERLGSGMKLDIMDIGWMTRLSAGFTVFGISFVFAGVLFNLLLVLLGLIKTLSIDFISPFIAQSTIGYVIYLTTGNYWLGLVAVLIINTISLILADWQHPMVEKFFGYKNLTLIQVGVNEIGLLAWPISKLLDKVPGLKEKKYTAEWASEKFGFFGEPMFVGFVIGVALGALAGYPFIQVVTTATIFAAALNIMPRMIGILMEGFIPIQEKLRDWLTKHAKGREIVIGMDPAIGTGHPSILGTAMLMVPITLVIALLLPGNHVFPLADLSVLVFSLMFCVVMNHGDLIRSLITSIICMVPVIYGANLESPYLMQLLSDQGIIQAGEKISNLSSGGAPYDFLFGNLFLALGSIGQVGMLVVLLAVLAVIVFVLWLNKNRKKQVQAAQAK